MNRVVIDTNILISWYKTGTISNSSDLAGIAPVFSIITKIEALGFREITESEIRDISKMLNTGELVYIDRDIAQRTITLRQKYKIKTPDAVIAATALVNNSELWTANTSDFSSIEGLKLHNPLI
jgi:predicted nucleic acid-binding protein